MWNLCLGSEFDELELTFTYIYIYILKKSSEWRMGGKIWILCVCEFKSIIYVFSTTGDFRRYLI